MGTSTFKKIYHLVTMMVAWFGLGVQLYVLISNTPENGMSVPEAIGRFFLFFTILTNLLIAILVTVLYLKRSSNWGKFFSRSSTLTAVAVYIFVVAMVYNIVLRPLFPMTGLNSLANEILHVIVPLLYLGFWVMSTDGERLSWKSGIGWQIYPAAYLVYALVRGKTEGVYPYPFLDLDKLGSSKVAMNCAGMVILFLGTSLLFIVFHNKVIRIRR